MIHCYLSRQFELDDGYCLVHLCYQAHILLIEIRAFLIDARLVNLAWVIGILLHGKCCKRNHIYCISVFESCHIGIAERETQHACDTAAAACSRTHP